MAAATQLQDVSLPLWLGRKHPDDLFCFPNGTRTLRKDLEGVMHTGEFRILYFGSRAYLEAVEPINLRD